MIPNSALMVPDGGASSGGRIIQAADTTYNVSNAGSDLTGDGSLAKPWATIQHAFNALAAIVDGGGFASTIKLAAGTYAGVEINGFPPNLGIYNLYGDRTTPANVKITNSPLFTNSCVEITVDNINLQIDGVQFQRGQAGFFIPLSLDNNFQNVSLGNVNFDSLSGTFGAGHDCIAINGNFSYLQFNTTLGGGTINVAGGWDNFVEIAPDSLLFSQGTFTSTGTIAFGTAFLNSSGGIWQDFNSNFSGLAGTGSRYKVFAGGKVVSLTGSPLGPNFFPGNTAGTVDGASFYDGFIGSYSGSGLPTTSTFVDPGTGAFYKDTSGGGVYWVFNDAGTIKKVALT